MMFKISTASLHTSRQTATRLTNRCCDVTMMSSLGTALPSKQEKIFTHLHAWSIAMEHAKTYEIIKNYLKYTNKTSGTFFSRAM